MQENISQGIRHGLWISRPAAKRRRQIFAARDMPRQFWMPGARKNPGQSKKDRRGFKYTWRQAVGGKADTFLHQRYIQWHLGQATGGRVTRDLFLNRRSAVQFLQDRSAEFQKCGGLGARAFVRGGKGGAPRQPCRPRFPWGSSSAYWLRLYFVKVSLLRSVPAIASFKSSMASASASPSGARPPSGP